MQKIKNKKITLLLILVLLTAILIILLFYRPGFLVTADQRNDTVTSSAPEALVNLNPATDQEKQVATETKQNTLAAEEKRNQAQPTENGKKIANPTITSATIFNNKLEINGTVSGVFEEGGECKATATRNDTNVSRTSRGVENFSFVTCPTIEIPVSDLSPGTWSIYLQYSSQEFTGKSSDQKVEVK